MKLTLPSRSWIAGLILLLVAIVLIWLAVTDSLTTDEKAHLPAGVSYVTAYDNRFNPEHPPLMKLLSGWSVMTAVQPHVPREDYSWEGLNQQLEFADAFFAANPTSARLPIILAARAVYVLTALILAGLVYVWVGRRYGQTAGLIALALTAISPTLLAHGHLVTFDVPAALGFFVALVSFAAFLKRPTWWSVIGAGLGLALALLVKFSSAVLVLIYFVGLGLWLVASKTKNIWPLVTRFIAVLLVATISVIAVYRFVTWGYAVPKNRADIEAFTQSYPRPLPTVLPILGGNRLTQPIGQYLTGMALTLQRARGGNTGYFLGEVQNTGDPRYFPLLFVTKEPLPTLALVLLAAVAVLVQLLWDRRKGVAYDWRQFILDRMPELLFGLTILVYWVMAIRSPLNIGYRHVYPTIPLVFTLTAAVIAYWLKRSSPYGYPQLRRLAVGGLLLWLFLDVFSRGSQLLNYYNPLAGGVENGYDLVVDSNYDWGQDLGRLAQYVYAHNIDQIALDYFGGDQPTYHLADRYVSWQSKLGRPTGWFAVSATIRQNAMGQHIAALPIPYEDTYPWLVGQTPVTRIGSIFVYRFE